MARIKKEFTFSAAVYINQRLFFDLFSVTAFMDVISTHPEEQTIAMERLKHFFNCCLDNSLIIFEDEIKIIDTFRNLNVKICTLPVEPYDQGIAIVLMHKLSAITEGKLYVTNLTLTSNLSDGVEYLVDTLEDYGKFDIEHNNWWHENNLSISNKKLTKTGKIVAFEKNNLDWTDLGLGWKKTIIPENQIIFTLDTEKT